MACAGQPGFEAEEGSGVMVPTPDVPNPAGQLQVSAVLVEGEDMVAFVTNTTPHAEALHLCTYDSRLQRLHREERNFIQPNSGVHFQVEVPCYWRWVILRESDLALLTCPETHRHGEDHPGLERLASGAGTRLCP